MQKAKTWRKRLSVFFACVVLASCVAGCTGDPSPSSEPGTTTTTGSQTTTTGSQTTTTGDATTSTTNGDSTTTTTMDARPTGGGLFNPTGTTATNGPTTTTTTNKPTTTTKVPTESFLEIQDNGLVRPQSDFMVTIPDYNPGMPGYDTVFTLKATYGDKKLESSDLAFKANLDGITFKDGKVTIPETVRDANDQTILTITYKEDPRYYYQYTIPFMHWNLTLEENFDTWNDDLWKHYKGGPGASYDECEYVKDGLLYMESKGNADGTVTLNSCIATEGKFTQSGGVYTCYIQLPDQENSCAAFWLMPQGSYGKNGLFQLRDQDRQAYCSEVDIFEIFWSTSRGDGHAIESNEIFWVNGDIDWGVSDNAIIKNPDYVHNSWHEISYVWTDFATYFFWDGQYFGGNNNIEPISGERASEAFIIFSNYGNCKGDPSYYEALKVDWMRIYK